MYKVTVFSDVTLTLKTAPAKGYAAVTYSCALKESDVKCMNGAENTQDMDGCRVFIASSTSLLPKGN